MNNSSIVAHIINIAAVGMDCDRIIRFPSGIIGYVSVRVITIDVSHFSVTARRKIPAVVPNKVHVVINGRIRATIYAVTRRQLNNNSLFPVRKMTAVGIKGYGIILPCLGRVAIAATSELI